MEPRIERRPGRLTDRFAARLYRSRRRSGQRRHPEFGSDRIFRRSAPARWIEAQKVRLTARSRSDRPRFGNPAEERNCSPFIVSPASFEACDRFLTRTPDARRVVYDVVYRSAIRAAHELARQSAGSPHYFHHPRLASLRRPVTLTALSLGPLLPVRARGSPSWRFTAPLCFRA